MTGISYLHALTLIIMRNTLCMGKWKTNSREILNMLIVGCLKADLVISYFTRLKGNITGKRLSIYDENFVVEKQIYQALK